MKKLLSLLLVVLMALTLAGCGEKDEETKDETLHVGVIQLMKHVALDAATQGFVDVLNEKLGDKVEVEIQYAGDGQAEICTTIANTYVSNEYDLIMGNATPALLAARNATDTIPVLGTSVTDFEDALKLQFVDGATGINVSGTSDCLPAVLYADCVMELVPTAKKVVCIYCSAESNSKIQYDNFKAEMNAKYPDVEVSFATFTDSNDISPVVNSVVADGVDAIYIPTDNTAAANMHLVSPVTTEAKVPVICGEEGMCSKGGLATVSLSYYQIGVQCGEMAYEILVNGADISKMPVQFATSGDKKYNVEYAAAIGFEMPADYAAITVE